MLLLIRVHCHREHVCEHLGFREANFVYLYFRVVYARLHQILRILAIENGEVRFVAESIRMSSKNSIAD